MCEPRLGIISKELDYISLGPQKWRKKTSKPYKKTNYTGCKLFNAISYISKLSDCYMVIFFGVRSIHVKNAYMAMLTFRDPQYVK